MYYLLEGNITLAKDVLILLDLVKWNIESELKMNMTPLDNMSCYNNNNDDRDDNDSMAVVLLIELTAAAYDDIRSKLINESNITKKKLPSHLTMTKHRPVILSYLFGQEYVNYIIIKVVIA